MADIGSTLGGRYRLVELLGQGGMATIYRAHDAQLDRHVAVKLLRPEYGRDPDFGSRFRQEAQSAASLNDPNIVAVHDFGQDPSGPFIVMELVDGEDLASMLRRNGPLPPRQAARVVAEAARALSTAHARGFVHRDVKPGNIMLARDGRVKVADFGIARAVAEAQMTLPGTTLGSVHYFSPEQARGEQADAASDIYSLGIVLFELLTGRRPWEGDSAAAIALARLSGMAPRPSDVRSGIPPALDAIVAKAMATDPHDRFSNATAFAESIETFLADRSASVGPGAAGAAGAAAAGAAGPTIASGVARPNPSARVPYSPDAYAGGDEPPPRPRAVPAGRRAPLHDDPDEPEGSSPWVWISGLLAILILAAVGFVLFQFLAGGTEPPPDEVEVPRFVGLTVQQAEIEAERVGLEVVQAATEERTDVPEGQVLAQDPAEGETAARGSEVRLTVAVGPGAVAVPDLRGRTEAEAIQLIIAAGLTVGERTEAFDPIIPEGAVISQDPRATIEVARGTAVNYELSQGPEPSPSPSPSPSPTPTPTPTPPPPTATPPVSLNVGDYRCMRLDEATAALVGDGFTLGSVTPQPEGYSAAPDSTVIEQSPAPGQKRPPGTAIDLVVYDPASLATCPP